MARVASEMMAPSQAPARTVPSRLFFRVRVGVLLTVLFIVVLWAWRDVRSRRERTNWERPLSVAIVLLRRGRLDEAAIDTFRSRVPALESRLADEMQHYRPDGVRPFTFTFFGPADLSDGEGAPSTSDDGIVAAAKESWALWKWTSRVDRAVGLDSAPYDSRIYVVARPPANATREVVEGESQEGGRIGIVEVELDASMADFALFVTAHELLHTLGATDKYDGAGRTLVPAGLADPDQIPLLPQAKAEAMARNRPISATEERPPTSLEELGVGPVTANEIGWKLAAF